MIEQTITATSAQDIIDGIEPLRSWHSVQTVGGVERLYIGENMYMCASSTTQIDLTWTVSSQTRTMPILMLGSVSSYKLITTSDTLMVCPASVAAPSFCFAVARTVRGQDLSVGVASAMITDVDDVLELSIEGYLQSTTETITIALYSFDSSTVYPAYLTMLSQPGNMYTNEYFPDLRACDGMPRQQGKEVYDLMKFSLNSQKYIMSHCLCVPFE